MAPGALTGDGGKTHEAHEYHLMVVAATRRTRGLEAAVIDNDLMTIHSLDDNNPRQYSVRVAGLVELLIAKLHKIAERIDSPGRLIDKNAHDIYRILRSMEVGSMSATFDLLLKETVCAYTTTSAIGYLRDYLCHKPKCTWISHGRAR